jgi:uncharacterized membrane protein YwzB
MNKVKIVFLTLILTATALGGFLFDPVQAALLKPDKRDDLEDYSYIVAEDSGYQMEKQELEDIIANIVRMVLPVIGAIFVTLIFVAGNQWMQAAGNEEKIKKSKGRIQSALVGLVIILIAYALSAGFSGVLSSLIQGRG